MAERTPIEDKRVSPLVHGLDKSVVTLGPRVVLSGEVDHDRRIGEGDAGRHRARREVHPVGDMFDLGGHIRLDGGEDIAVAHADAQGAAAAHGDAAQVDAVLVDAVLLDHPFHRVDYPFVRGADLRALVFINTPPPVSLVGAAIEIERKEVFRRTVEVVVADRGRAAQARVERRARRNGGRRTAARWHGPAWDGAPGTCRFGAPHSPIPS